ncbi:MAG: type I methionyl aminopeptidase [Nitrospirae bacterium]|nr:MAG: type I methionyl aminopeptidase [Nitrospirota bacterium]
MIIVKSQAEIIKIEAACKIVAEILEDLKTLIKPGITTFEIESHVENRIKQRKAVAAFKGYRGYPASVCVSINEQVVHGIPSRKVRIKDGDIVSIDFGAIVDGFYGDAAVTVPAGEISAESSRLLKVTEEALYIGIEKAVVGNRVSDISAAIQKHVESNGFSVVRAFVGHGIGRSLHEDPQIPNYGRQGEGPRLKSGMTLAIEPMVNSGVPDVDILGDGWTAVTADRRPSAHFEHTIAVMNSGPCILTKIEDFR